MHPVNQLVDFCYGKEAQTDDIGAVARFVKAHVTSRPAEGGTPRWSDIDAVKTHGRHYAPHVTADAAVAQIDVAAAAAGV
jgi:hypothetical protein